VQKIGEEAWIQRKNEERRRRRKKEKRTTIDQSTNF
jgi:hypothetical protein